MFKLKAVVAGIVISGMAVAAFAANPTWEKMSNQELKQSVGGGFWSVHKVSGTLKGLSGKADFTGKKDFFIVPTSPTTADFEMVYLSTYPMIKNNLITRCYVNEAGYWSTTLSPWLPYTLNAWVSYYRKKAGFNWYATSSKSKFIWTKGGGNTSGIDLGSMKDGSVGVTLTLDGTLGLKDIKLAVSNPITDKVVKYSDIISLMNEFRNGIFPEPDCPWAKVTRKDGMSW